MNTNPLVADTDGDGLSDGEEAGEPTTRLDPSASYPVGVVYSLFSDPTRVDTDGDGVDDAVEFDDGTRPWARDLDGDLLDDSEERDHNTDPFTDDTDGDGFGDNQEVAEQDQGFHPLYPDERVSKWRYVGDFTVGLVAGDGYQIDSIAWLVGSLAGGALSFIPAVGWIVGGVADLRDVVANTIRGDWVGVGFSAAGIVPYAGDAAAILGKTGKFVERNVDKLDEVAQAIAKSEGLPVDVRVAAIGEALKKSGVDIDVIKNARFTDNDLLRLAKGRTDWKVLQQMVEGSTATRLAASPGFRNGWLDGERWFRQVDGGTAKYLGVEGFGRGRFIDSGKGFDDLGGAVLKEVKTGNVGKWKPRREEIIRQIRKDSVLQGEGARVEYHFLPNGRNNSIGAHPDILRELDANRIPYVVYPPGS